MPDLARIPFALAGALLLLPAPALGATQEGDEPPVVVHFVAPVVIVKVPVIVQTEDGSDFVQGLGQEAFEIVDGSPHAPEHFISDQEAASVGLIVDVGDGARSLATESIATATQVLEKLDPGHDVFLMSFADTAEVVAPPTDDPATITPRLQELRFGGGAALDEALLLGIERLEGSASDKRILIVITVEAGPQPRTGQERVRRAANATGVAIYTILLSEGVERWRPQSVEASMAAEAAEAGGFAVGASVDADLPTSTFLQQLGHRTGGLSAIRPPVAHDLSRWIGDATRDITNYVNHQYLLFYAPSDPPRPGEWRQIAVRAPGKVRARPGYQIVDR